MSATEPTTSIRSGAMRGRRARAVGSVLVVLLGALLLVRALELRMPGMSRPFWEDEIHHNAPILSTGTVGELLDHRDFRMMCQPLLDSVLRQQLWFPLLGVDERALRVPALAYGVAQVLLVYAFAIVAFASRLRLVYAAWLAFGATIWIVDNPTQIHDSAEARQYTLVGLASMLWCGLLFLHGGRPRWLFAFATLLFANAHFFSLPVIAGGYAMKLAGELRRRAVRPVVFDVLVLLAVVVATLVWNVGPLETLLERTPTQAGMSVPLDRALDASIASAAFDLWRDYDVFLALPVSAWIAWVGMLALCAHRREARWLPFLSAVLVVLPAFFVYVRLRSDYPFKPAYFTPFLGFGLVTLLAVADLALEFWESLARRISPRARSALAGAALVAPALVMGVPAFAQGLSAERGALARVERNFSPWYAAYREVGREHKPVFVLHSHCWTSDVPRTYLNRLVPPSNVFRGAADSKGCRPDAAVTRIMLLRFLAEYGSTGGFVLLDERESSCQGRAASPIDFPGSVERLSSVDLCMWKVRGARSLRDLRVAAAAVGFPAAPAFFGE